MKNVLYISQLYHESLFGEYFKCSKVALDYAANNLSRAILKGFRENNAPVEVLNAPVIGSFPLYYMKEICEAKEYQQKPSILHYSARIKPWDWKCTHPLASLYYDYAEYSVHYKHLRKPSVVVAVIAHVREYVVNLLVKVKHFKI